MRRAPSIARGRGVSARALALCLASAALASRGAAQDLPRPVVSLGDRSTAVVVHRDRGYAAAPLALLRELGADVDGRMGEWRVRLDTTELLIVDRTPFVRAGGRILQLADPPYERDGELQVPLQLLTEVLPAVLPGRYRTGGSAAPVPAEPSWGPTSPGEERARAPRPSPPAGRDRTHAPPDDRVGSEASRTPARRTDRVTGASETAGSRRRVVVIDPGHGGADPGALGTGGAREKDVALALAQALAVELARHPSIEVHLTREDDVLVPLWQRGDWATRRKGDRPGIFLSLHANALPRQRDTRGFETYFLSEARTDHERRVAANENAPLAMAAEDGGVEAQPDLDFILRELRNLDHQHWSALLAELVQTRLASVHPGPDRGVKQAPFAVITNALMPAVLVEVGFITHREEERLLLESGFHEKAAGALAEAVLAFFERYPPGQVEPGGDR